MRSSAKVCASTRPLPRSSRSPPRDPASPGSNPARAPSAPVLRSPRRHWLRPTRQARTGGAVSPLELSYPFRLRDDVRQTYAELVVDCDDLALRDQATVDQHIHRFARQAVEFDDRALGKLQYLADRDLGAPKLDGQLDRNVENQVDIVGARRATGLGRERRENRRCPWRLRVRDHC